MVATRSSESTPTTTTTPSPSVVCTTMAPRPCPTSKPAAAKKHPTASCRVCRVASHLKEVRRDDGSKLLEAESAANAANEPITAISRANPIPAQHKPQRRRARQPAPADSSHNDSSVVDVSNEGSFFSDESYPDEDNAAQGDQEGVPESDDGHSEDVIGQGAAAAPGGAGASSGSSNRSPSQKPSSSSSSDQSSSEDESNRGENRCNQMNGSEEGSCGEPTCNNCHPENTYESVPSSSEPPSFADDDFPSGKEPSPSEVHTESDPVSSESADESSSESEQPVVDEEYSSSHDPSPSEVDAHDPESSCGPDCNECHHENLFGQPAPSSSSSSGLGE
jgi:hypothetical protein